MALKRSDFRYRVWQKPQSRWGWEAERIGNETRIHDSGGAWSEADARSKAITWINSKRADSAAQVLPSRIYGNPPLFDQIVWESEPVQSNPPPGIRIRQGGAPMRIRTFEYLIEYEGGADDNLPAIGDVLANAGLEGWRLVSSERGRLIFEREIL